MSKNRKMRIKWVLVQTLAIALLLGSLPLQPVSSVQAAGNYNYAEALQKAIYFYETQRSGRCLTRTVSNGVAIPVCSTELTMASI